MRTDLDVFSEVECAALMASGYKAIDAQLNELFNRVPALAAERVVHGWFFSPLLPVVEGPEHNEPAFEQVKEQLQAGSSALGRSVKLDRRVRAAVIAFSMIVGVLVTVLLWKLPNVPILTVGAIGISIAAFVVSRLLGDWAALLIDPRGALRAPTYSWAGAILLWAFSNAVVKWVDPRYRRRGNLARVLRHSASGS